MGQQEKQPVENDLRKAQSFTQVSFFSKCIKERQLLDNFFSEIYTGVTFLLLLNMQGIKINLFEAFSYTVSYNCIKSIYINVSMLN